MTKNELKTKDSFRYSELERIYVGFTLPNNYKPASFSDERWIAHKEAARKFGWNGGFYCEGSTYKALNGSVFGT